MLHAEGFGGSERHTVDLVNHLTSSGWRLTLVFSGLDLRDRGIREAPGSLEVVRPQLPVVGLSRADARAWRRLFLGLPAARVLLVKPWYYAADVRFLRVLRRSYDTVFHLEHSLPPERLPYRVRLWYGLIPGLGLWWFRDQWRRWRMSRTADRVVTVSEAGRVGMVRHAFCREQQVVSCPNGVDLNHWVKDREAGLAFRQRLGLGEDVYLFGSVSHLIPIKGLDLALRAFARVVHEGPRPAAYAVVGDGPLRSDLESLARGLGVRDRVHFVGHLPDVRPAYSALDTLLLPSTTESFPLSCLEAMACGGRVIASAVGGVPEVLGDPVCGELLAARAPEAWAAAMLRHLATPVAERTQRADAIRAYVAREHDQRRRFQELETVLRGSSTPKKSQS